MANPKETIPPMQAAELYREDVFTDRSVGTIRRMTPVTALGETDPARPTLFVGSTQLLTAAGPLPLTFELEARTLAEAVEKFSPTAEEALRETIEELAAMRREQQSGLVIPGGPGGGGLGGLGGLGGPGRPGRPGPGGGKLRL